VTDDIEAGRVKTNIDGIQRLRTPFVRTAEGKGRFLNVTCLYTQISQVFYQTFKTLKINYLQKSMCKRNSLSCFAADKVDTELTIFN
jgi:hypothetical protein